MGKQLEPTFEKRDLCESVDVLVEKEKMELPAPGPFDYVFKNEKGKEK